MTRSPNRGGNPVGCLNSVCLEICEFASPGSDFTHPTRRMTHASGKETLGPHAQRRLRERGRRLGLARSKMGPSCAGRADPRIAARLPGEVASIPRLP